MEILYLLEKIRVPVLNEAMLLITRLGEETAFLALALIVFWCVDKQKGYYLMTVGFLGTMLNQFMKLWFRVPRPWILDPNFTILEQAREAATGYSFPSGHSQTAVGTFGSIAATTKNTWIKWACILISILVPFSRIYIGVHTPADVLVGSGMALALVMLLKPLSGEMGEKWMPWLIGLMVIMSVASLFYVDWLKQINSMDPRNFESGVKNAYTMLGCMAGISIVYFMEKKYVNFSTKGCWWVQILKVLLGLAAVLLVKEGLRTPLELVFSQYTARSVRYFLIVKTAGLLWPMTFSCFQKLGAKNELRCNKKL